MIAFEAPLFKWSGGNWFFVQLSDEAAAEARFEAAGLRGGFGSIKVVATVGATEWRTSLFPDKASGSFFLPIKRSVRDAEGIEEDDRVRITLEVAG